MILLEAFQISSGKITPPLEDTTPTPYVIAPWTDTTRSFLHHINATIQIPQLKTLTTIRIKDKAIMEHATRQQFSTTQLEEINRCRMHLQVTTLAKICTSDGTRILPEALSGTSDTNTNPILWQTSTSNLSWAKQPRPDNKTWKTWQRCLKAFVRSE